MATFYGTIKGNRGGASRVGSYKSGMKATVQSWKGSVIVEMNQVNSADEPTVSIFINDHESSAYGTCIFEGTIEQLKKRLS